MMTVLNLKIYILKNNANKLDLEILENYLLSKSCVERLKQ